MHDFDRIAAIIQYLEQHRAAQPGLTELARVAGLSPWHLQRLFSRWAGVSPKAFLQALTQAHARQLLQQGAGVLETALAIGLSGPGRLHDLCVRLECASPGEIKAGGRGWTLQAGFADSPFGDCLVGISPRGVCHLSFTDRPDRDRAEQLLLQDWPRAGIAWDPAAAGAVADQVFNRPGRGMQRPGLRAFVRGSEFQLRVWRALLAVPEGTLVSYGRLAAALGHPRAARAVGSAVAGNTLAGLIPCHRVIRESGLSGDYRWGSVRKQALIARETAGRQSGQSPSTPDAV